MTKHKRLELLDCIRAAAILMIIAYHVAIEFPPEKLDAVWSWLAKYGFLGVDVFFPLSGFLITLFLSRNHDPAGIKVFFTRRVFRIIPIYLIAVGCYFVVAEALNREPGIETAWINLLFLTGWVILIEGKANVPFTITWSLSVEEFAYILCGLSFLFLRSRAPIALVVLSVGSVLVRAAALHYGLPKNEVYSFPLARLDSVFLGALTALGVLYMNKRTLLVTLLAFLCVQLLVAQTSTLAFRVALYPSVATAVCLIIVVIWTYFHSFSSLASRFFAAIGALAYFMYLFHYFFLYGIQMVAQKIDVDLSPTGLMAMTTALTWLAAYVSWTKFELPLIEYGRSLETRFKKQTNNGAETTSSSSGRTGRSKS